MCFHVIWTDIRYLQNFTIYTRRNLLRAECQLAKSDIFVACQLVILNAKSNNEVLSPVNIVQPNFSMLLPSDRDSFLVTARAVDRYGTVVDSEMFAIGNIIHPINNTPRSTSTSNFDGKAS